MITIFISGWGFGNSLWIPFLSDHKCECIDWRHFTDKNKLKNTITKLKGYSSINLIGWSLGSLIALSVALEIRVNKLVLISPTACILKKENYNGISPSYIRAMQSKLNRNKQNVLHDFMSLVSDNKSSVSNFSQECIKNFSIPELVGGLAYLEHTDIRMQINNICTKVLIFHGINDRVVPVSQAKYVRSRIKKSEIILLDAGHDIPISKSKYIYTNIAGFIF